ncbi:hypothetical protein IAU60_006384 [Kwoniella sp. DSM 27419]
MLAYAFPLRTRDGDNDQPPSPLSYLFPLLLVVAACGGYLYYRRTQRRREGSIPMHFSSRGTSGIRLSEDGPPTHSFTHDNASTDSLPTHALDHLPDLGIRPTTAVPPSIPRAMLDGTAGAGSAENPLKKASPARSFMGRRSTRGRGRAVEESDSEEERSAQAANPFGLGLDESEGERDEGDDRPLGPLGG